jgi:hypothetical protein
MACLNTKRSDIPNTPPRERIETFTPVFPNGRVGTVTGEILFEPLLSEAFTKGASVAIIDPAPMAPAAFKKVRRESFFSFFDIGSPFPFILYFRMTQILHPYSG